MPIIQSCCCWRSLRRGCYAAALYTMVYFSVTIVTMGHFIEVEQRYLNGDMVEPESESFLEPEKITPITVSLNITLLACSTLGLIACVLLIFGVHKDIKFMLLPWVFAMGLETLVEVVNLVYLFYLQTLNFNPITSFLFTLDFFIIVLNIYAMVCVISQFQEYLEGRGTAAFDYSDRQLAAVQYTATAQHTTTTSSAPSGRRRSAPRPLPSRCDPEDFSEAPTRVIAASVLSKPSRSAVKKHVQFPDEQSCIEEASEVPTEEKTDRRVISSLWMELESETPAPER
ncbi:uncharacterized protein LOC116777930 [Danaus plexippus]|uniref:Uncharacterized protein n=1 Tax=Danaus plexippus plexippus TaxID=278856 RepID=A0A212FM96_DANPL|nr:uncharacterized protein LOC116777930 [Danaus plexippus]OWR54863.1 hypothetical protein KGM_207145 [Danaus plexippus plexippus]